jgi:hypothetical protein
VGNEEKNVSNEGEIMNHSSVTTNVTSTNVAATKLSTIKVATHTTSMNATKIIILNDQKNQTMVIMFLLVCSLLS